MCSIIDKKNRSSDCKATVMTAIQTIRQDSMRIYCASTLWSVQVLQLSFWIRQEQVGLVVRYGNLKSIYTCQACLVSTGMFMCSCHRCRCTTGACRAPTGVYRRLPHHHKLQDDIKFLEILQRLRHLQNFELHFKDSTCSVCRISVPHQTVQRLQRL